MGAGRPVTGDDPAKYAAAYELFRLTGAGGAAGQTAAEQIGAFLHWAVSTGQAGFGVGEFIVVGTLAESVKRSRNTAAGAIGRLVAAGMVVQDKPKSPYRIISNQAIFTDAGQIADEQISLTIKLDSVSLFSAVRPVDAGNRDEKLAAFLADELAASADALIRAAATPWSAAEVQAYLRLRTRPQQGRAAAYLVEITFVRLAPAAATGFRERIERLRQAGVPRISMYTVLEQCGLKDLRAGRTQVTIGSPPAWLGPELAEIQGVAAVDLSPFSEAAPLLKWTYALFRPAPEPMVTFSVCYVRSDMLGIFMRSLDVEPLPLPGISRRRR